MWAFAAPALAVVLPRLQDLTSPLHSTPTTAYNHINCVANAAGFFNNVRTPATLLVIPALNILWIDLSSTTQRTKHPVAQTLYTMSVMLTVLLELVCVVVATVAGTRLLAGGFDPMSTDAVTLLVREFELPYLTTHLSFVSGLVSFLSAIGLRAWIQFGETHEGLRKAYALITVTFVANIVAYFHTSVFRFHFGLPGLLVRFFVLYLDAFRLFGAASLLALGYAARLVYRTIRDQLARHGVPTGGLSVDQLPTGRYKSKSPNEARRSWKPEPFKTIQERRSSGSSSSSP